MMPMCRKTTSRRNKLQPSDELRRFALDLESRFNNGNCILDELIDPGEMQAIGFQMDCFESLNAARGRVCAESANLQDALSQVTDIYAVGSGFFSEWRYLTYWCWGAESTEELALLIHRLVELTA